VQSPEVVERGVDTWRFARYLERDGDIERAAALCPEGRFLDRLSGHRVGFLPGQRMLWVEGRASVDGLADPAVLGAVHGDLLEQLAMAGFPLGRDAGLGRVDGTATLATGDALRGRAILAGLAALDVPRCKPVVHGKPPQTVYLESGRSARKHARVYDKGIEQGTARAGELLRFEDQRRYAKEQRRAVVDMDGAQIGRKFQQRFGAMARSARGVRVQSVPVMQRELAERVNGSEVSRRQAEGLLGYVALEQAGARALSPATSRRRRAKLREQGLVVADDFFAPVDVDLSEPLELVLEAWR
jgi:hypothetical protein